MFKILVVEDDNELNRLFCKTLVRNGYEALNASDAVRALEILETESVDLIISDVMMPGIDGFEFVRQLREAQMTLPVMMITAKSDIKDKQSGFLSGADDYMVKPVDLQEMLLRVQALLRRAKSVSERRLSFGGTSLLYDVWTVEDAQGSQILPQKEFQLLYKLLSYPGQIFTRQQILDDIWGPEGYVDSHTLDVHISRLRERFKKNEDFEIVTIRGLGYRAVKKNG
ncbi:MAG: response regulator transcription factor [Lachnospiraceae bacterium]|nr:response regulator transcription factor [Lachnospiraceae bacterium]